MSPPDDPEAALAVAVVAARRAAAAILERRRRPAVWTKPDGSPVTSADMAADAAIRATVREAFPRPWARTVAEARAIQERLRCRVRLGGGPRRASLVAGADLAYRADGRWAWAAAVLMEYPEGRGVEWATAEGPPSFPYVPGYLTFREGPLLLAAFTRLRRRPHLCLFDGQGRPGLSPRSPAEAPDGRLRQVPPRG